MTKCKNCKKEFEYPAYVKYNVSLGLIATFLTPACPHCMKPLYVEIPDEKPRKKAIDHIFNPTDEQKKMSKSST